MLGEHKCGNKFQVGELKREKENLIVGRHKIRKNCMLGEHKRENNLMLEREPKCKIKSYCG
jgi:hypothetical protein